MWPKRAIIHVKCCADWFRLFCCIFCYCVCLISLCCIYSFVFCYRGEMQLYTGVNFFLGGSHRFSDPAPWLRSTTSNNRSCTSQLRSGTFSLVSATLHSLYLSIFFYARCFVKKCSPSRSFHHLHLFMLCVDRCCKPQTLFKCNKSQTECLECSKTPGRRSGTQPLLSALLASRL